MNSISPYLCFNGKCRQAMTFYQECLGGELEFKEVAGSPAEKFWEGPKDQIFHAKLSLANGHSIMGSDMTDQSGYIKGTDIALALDCANEEEIHFIFDNLSRGGKLLSPLELQFWGGIFGAFEDPFGIKWMLNCNL